METKFSLEQLADAAVAHSESILRKCVHCGFCTATCPTYLTLGDELDSPRGRIYLIKDMLENDRAADEKTVKHVDRCLSCLACMTTCPSGVHYMHLVDHARTHIENTYKRPLLNRLYRNLLATVLPYPARFKLALQGAKLAKPFSGVIKKISGLEPLSAMLELAPSKLPKSKIFSDVHRPGNATKGRVALLGGCAQKVLDPAINEATIDLLNRLGVEVNIAPTETCCGSLVHHMGREEAAHHQARNNIDAWLELETSGPLDAIIITASGCGTTIKDYGHMLREDNSYAQKAARVSALACDITEYLDRLDLPANSSAEEMRVAYHSACSMQHGQKITDTPKKLLKAAGFIVKEPPEGHLCCGSAGTYNILQKEIAEQLKKRKISNINTTKPQAVATGNIGCMTQLGSDLAVPILHTVELLNWAYGGKKPEKLK